MVVVGIDAGTPALVNKWTSEGKLPTFDLIAREGVQGILLSTMPPQTPPAWSSFITGVNPGKHGVFDFLEWHRKSPTPVSSRSIRAPTLWSIVSRSGKKVVALNVPMTYPPETVNGVIVPGMMSPGEEISVWPPEIKKRIERNLPDYRIHRRTGYIPGNESTVLNEMMELLRMRRDLALDLMENYEWDLFVVAFYYIDQIQHMFWGLIDPSHPLYGSYPPAKAEEAILRGYQMVDDALERILDVTDENTYVMVMSDHGSGPAYGTVSINHWLSKLGLLAFGDGLRNSASWLDLIRKCVMRIYFRGITNRAIARLVKTGKRTSVRIHRKARTVLGAGERRGHMRRISQVENVDWSKTKAFQIPSVLGEIYVNLEGRTPRGTVEPGREYKELLDYLEAELVKLRGPSGEKLVGKVFRREELYRGACSDLAPDLLFPLKNMRYVATDVRRRQVSGTHRMEGMVMIRGNGVAAGKALKGANIIDLAPTILYMMGLSIPTYMDGKVLTEAFEGRETRSPEYAAESLPPVEQERQVYTDKESEEIKARLRRLGYY